MAPTPVPDSEPPYEMVALALSQPNTGDDSTSLASLDGLIDDLASTEDEDELHDLKETRRHADGGSGSHVPEDLLDTDLDAGLQDAEAATRRGRYGANELKEERKNHFLAFMKFFVGPIQFVMEAAAILALALQKWADCGVIVGLLVLNAVVGFLQDFSAGNTVKELKKSLARRCKVVRHATISEQEARLLVPGDIVVLEEGAVVPADGKLRALTGVHLQVDQSAITGESMATTKYTDDVLFQSSVVRRGEGRMIVTATGEFTFVGRSATLVNATTSGRGNFARVVNSIGTTLLGLVTLTLIIVLIACSTRNSPLREVFETFLTIIIIGVPVGLPAVMTTTMAVGASFLAKKKAIVQRLSAIESLAGVEILCSDKTGTLTRNKLTLGPPYTVKGVNSNELILCACLAAGRKAGALDPIDKALLKALGQYGQAKRSVPQFQVVEFTPFDPVSKYVVAVVQGPDGKKTTCVKGAPTAVIQMVAGESTVDPLMVKEYKEVVADFAARGFRALGVARKREGRSWELLGILSCMDPLRYDTVEVVNEAKGLGIKIKMLTGDALGIARETSRKLGIGSKIYCSGNVILEEAVPATSDLYDFMEAADGFAEMFPQHKYNVIDILQKRGFLVAMTGDGVNDAPSLKIADTGIAVQGASDAARSAADIVFLAPGLGAIVDALKTSRQIFHRMHAYLVYRIALSIHLLLFLGTVIIFMPAIRLNLTLILFIAISADIATLAIAYDNAPYSRVPVRWNVPQLWFKATVLGVVLAVGTWLAEIYLLRYRGLARDSLIFLQIILSQNWLIFITRTSGHNWLPLPSWQLVLAVVTVDTLAVVVCVFGWFASDCTAPMSSCRPLLPLIPQILLQAVAVSAFTAGVFCVIEGMSLSLFKRRRT